MLIRNLLLVWLMIGFSQATTKSRVKLKMMISVPRVTLECTISDYDPSYSLFLNCPALGNICFRNCQSTCTAKSSCPDIDCAQSTMSDGSRRFIFVFDGATSANQGEWSCSYHSEKSATIYYMDQAASGQNTKRNVPIIPKVNNQSVVNLYSAPVRPQTAPAAARHSEPSLRVEAKQIVNRRQTSTVTGHFSSPGTAAVSLNYVIILLIIFCISLIINIVLVIREIIISISSKKAFNGQHNACFKCLFKSCGLEHMFVVKGLHNAVSKRNGYLHQNGSTCSSSVHDCNNLISRQASSNTYDYQHHNGSAHILPPAPPPHIFSGQNMAYLPSPLMPSYIQAHAAFYAAQTSPGQYPRSQSYNQTSSSGGSGGATPDIFAAHHLPPRHQQHGGSGPQLVVYDDVPDPSIYCHLSPGSFVTGQRPTKNGLQRQLSLQHRLTNNGDGYTMSLDNLTDSRCLESETDENGDSTTMESALKRDISSRMELSKEMISQADDLLRRADTILNNRKPATAGPNAMITSVSSNVANDPAPLVAMDAVLQQAKV